MAHRRHYGQILSATLFGIFLAVPQAFPQAYNMSFVGHCGCPADIVYATGEQAYVGAGSVFSVIDVSNPRHPVRVGRIEFSGKINDLNAEGDYAYVTTSDNSLQVVDVSRPFDPVTRGIYGVGRGAYGLDVRDHIAYVADPDALLILDLKDHDKPSLIGSYETAARKVVLRDNLPQVVVSRPDGFDILDISVPETPVPIGSNMGVCGYVAVFQDSVFTKTSGGGEIKVFDVGNPSEPIQVAMLNLGTGTMDIFADDRYLYMSGDGVGAFNLDDPAEPALRAYCKVPFTCRYTRSNGKLLFMCSGAGGLSIVRHIGNEDVGLYKSDINEDGSINGADQMILMQNWRRTNGE